MLNLIKEIQKIWKKTPNIEIKYKESVEQQNTKIKQSSQKKVLF